MKLQDFWDFSVCDTWNFPPLGAAWSDLANSRKHVGILHFIGIMNSMAQTAIVLFSLLVQLLGGWEHVLKHVTRRSSSIWSLYSHFRSPQKMEGRRGAISYQVWKIPGEDFIHLFSWVKYRPGDTPRVFLFPTFCKDRNNCSQLHEIIWSFWQNISGQPSKLGSRSLLQPPSKCFNSRFSLSIISHSPGIRRLPE